MSEGKDGAATSSKASSSAAAEGKSSKVTFTIKKWNAVAFWSWDIYTDTCAICRNALHGPSIEYQVRFRICRVTRLRHDTFMPTAKLLCAVA